MKELGIRNKNERTGNVICKTWNDDQHIKVQKGNIIHTEKKLSFMLYKKEEQ